MWHVETHNPASAATHSDSAAQTLRPLGRWDTDHHANHFFACLECKTPTLQSTEVSRNKLPRKARITLWQHLHLVCQVL